MNGLKQKRKERGMTLLQLANAIGVKQAAVFSAKSSTR